MKPERIAIIGGAFAAFTQTSTLAHAADNDGPAARSNSVVREATNKEIKAEIRAKVAAGQIDPRRLIHPIDSSVAPGAPPPARFPSSPNAGAEGNFPLDVDYFDDFSTYELTDCTNPPESIVPIAGQLDPAGFEWAVTNLFVGVADEEVILEGGGVPPTGAPLSTGEPPGAFLTAPRETCDVELFTDFPGVFGNTHHQGFTFESGGEPLRVSEDFYLTDITNGQWWAPTDFANGFVVTRLFLGGSQLAGALGPFLNEQGVLNRATVLGWMPTNGPPETGVQFFAPPSHPATNIPENQWFTIMLHMSHAPGAGVGYSVWIKTQATTGGAGTPEDPQFLDPRMANGSIPPVDDEPDGWVDIYPGHLDDHDAENEPLPEPTPGVIEGIGFAHNDVDQSAEGVIDDSHLQQSQPIGVLAITGLQQGFVHSDPTDADPETFPQDAFWDNYTASGAGFDPCFDLAGPEVICPSTGEAVPTIDGADLGFLLGEWGENPGSPADLNGDDIVSGGDIGILLGAWGPCPVLCPNG